MKLPGALWTALLVAVPLLAVWVQDSFPGAIWAVPVTGLLLIAAKVIQAIHATFTPEETNLEMYAEAKPERSTANIIILG